MGAGPVSSFIFILKVFSFCYTPKTWSNPETRTHMTEEVKETKAERFERLAVKRMKQALNELRKLEALSNKATYDWDAETAREMQDVLLKAVKKVTDKFDLAPHLTPGEAKELKMKLLELTEKRHDKAVEEMAA